MATIKFVLSKSEHQRKTNSNLSMLMLRYGHQKKTTLFYTSRNIEDRYWDDKGQQIRKAMQDQTDLIFFSISLDRELRI